MTPREARAASTARLNRGDVIGGRYRVWSWLEDESASHVYEAREMRLGRLVALKVIDTDAPAAEREAEIAAMEREALAASMVEHPGVAHILDFEPGTSRGRAFLVRERLYGTTLATALRVAGRLPIDDAGDLIVQILSALGALHRAGIIHRALGTQSIVLVERSGCRPLVKITNLGDCQSPKLLPPDDPPLAVHYCAPEILGWQRGDFTSDLFSCGVMLYEMLTGRRPFEGANEDEVRYAILGSDVPPSAASLRPGLGDKWLRILDRALQKTASARYPSAHAFQQDLPTLSKSWARLRSLADDASAGQEDDTTLQVPPSRPASSSRPSSRRSRAPVASSCDPWIGRHLGKKYLIQNLLGSGASGAVYRALHVDLQRPIAIKVLHPWNRSSQAFAARFKAEALAASRLNHPNITRVVDFGAERDGTLYLAMEYVEGPSLEAVMHAEGRLPPERAVRIAVQICSSLVAAHAVGIIHRDIKPENIMLTESPVDGKGDYVKVCDFGLAKRDASSTEALTTPGLIFGSPAYMAPEQVDGSPVDGRTDIYALGVTLFEMLTGRLPQDATTVAECLLRKKDLPPPLSSFLPEVDPLLEDIVLHTLAPDPEQRQESVRVLRDELTEALEGLLAPASRQADHVTIWPEPASSLPKDGDVT